MMIIYRDQIDSYIRCPFQYAISVLKSKQSVIKTKNSSIIKKHLVEIASHEMQNDLKLSLQEYRTRFTNKYYKKADDLFAEESIIKKLNSVFELFANNAFCGYNIPVEIPIAKTSSCYRNLIDFILTDDDSNISVAEIVSLDNSDGFIERLRNWPHYYITYSYIARQFDRNVTVYFIDPTSLQKIKIIYNGDRYEKDLEQLRNVIIPIDTQSYYYNLFSCEDCQVKEDCDKRK